MDTTLLKMAKKNKGCRSWHAPGRGEVRLIPAGRNAYNWPCHSLAWPGVDEKGPFRGMVRLDLPHLRKKAKAAVKAIIADAAKHQKELSA
jgi:hypothetical protein